MTVSRESSRPLVPRCCPPFPAWCTKTVAKPLCRNRISQALIGSQSCLESSLIPLKRQEILSRINTRISGRLSRIFTTSCLITSEVSTRSLLIFPLKTRPLAGKFPCAVMGSTGGSHDTETAHGGTDHRSPEGCPSGHRGPRALPQARHFGCHFLQVAGEVCGTRSQRCEEAALPRRRKPAVETDGGGASPGHPGAESGHHKKLVGPKAKRTAAQWLAERFGLSQRRVCRLLAVDRNTLRYRCHRQADTALRTRIREMAESKRRYGCPRIYVWLRREGWPVNHKKVDRLYYREEQLALQRRCHKK